MEIFIGKRSHGKTHRLLQEMAQSEKSVMICFSYSEAERCFREAQRCFPRRRWIKEQFITLTANDLYQNARGFTEDTHICVDNAEMVLAKLLNVRPDAISIGAENKFQPIIPPEEGSDGS